MDSGVWRDDGAAWSSEERQWENYGDAADQVFGGTIFRARPRRGAAQQTRWVGPTRPSSRNKMVGSGTWLVDHDGPSVPGSPPVLASPQLAQPLTAWWKVL
eukprot:COSAG06_NODE_11813_length_1461_cov_21.603524_2_plen_101_part_00